MQATFITVHTLLQPKAKTHIRLQSNIFCSGAHIFVSLLILAAVSEASHLCRYMKGASRENTSNPTPILFLFISTILMSSDSLGNKIHNIHHQRPNAPSSSSAPRPVCHPGWQPRTRQSSQHNGWSWRWLYIRERQSTHFAMRQKSPHLTLQPLFTRHYFVLRWNWSPTCWSCGRKLIPEGIRDIFTDEGC